uniref:Uncharacterized protein n=1 Tax=Anguilla anguilla TaxID=7936 RepID=A0A0E9TUX6_ANGAN
MYDNTATKGDVCLRTCFLIMMVLSYFTKVIRYTSKFVIYSFYATIV